MARICQIKIAKHDLVAPNLAEEVLKDVNRQLLAWTPSVSKAEWSKPGIIANGMSCPINNPENRSEAAVRDVGLAPILYFEIGDFEWTPREANLPTLIIVDLGAGRNVEKPL